MDWDKACCGDSDDSRNPGRSTGLGKRDFLKCLFSSLTVRDSRSCLSSASCKFLNNEAEKKGHMELFYFFGIGVGNKKGRSKMIKMKWMQQFGGIDTIKLLFKKWFTAMIVPNYNPKLQMHYYFIISKSTIGIFRLCCYGNGPLFPKIHSDGNAIA